MHTKNCIRIIGDIHGRKNDHLNFANQAEYSIQIGDLGFSYDYMSSLDPKKHKWFPGNHDNYDKYLDSPNCLGDYGQIDILGDEAFFLRGGFSIDWKYRIPGIDWWNKEELSMDELEEAFQLYSELKPKILITHEPPFFLLPYITDGRVAREWGYGDYIETRTNITLDRMFKVSKPDLWIYAHMHRDYDNVVDGTRFMCLTADTSFNCKQRFFDLDL